MITNFKFLVEALALSVFMSMKTTEAASTSTSWTAEKLTEMITDIKGEDERLVRWDAGDRTFERQSDGACDILPEIATDVIVNNDGDLLLQRLACEFATFCITDNPIMRSKFSDIPGIHQAIVNLVKSSNNEVSAIACHVVYIASFNNAKNQRGFFNAGIIPALATIILVEDHESWIASQIMWAMAALQNLSASYCDTKQDGRCYWTFPEGSNQLVISENSLPITADGSAIRKAAIAIPHLVTTLIEYACEGPVEGLPEDGYVLPGDNALVGHHDNDQAIMNWAATGALKNLAIEYEGREIIDVDHGLGCFCEMSKSYDWLEENKGEGLLWHLRSHDPCLLDDNHEVACIDDFFWDNEGYSCKDYGPYVSDEECEALDTTTHGPASDFCCHCGGGTKYIYSEDYDYSAEL